MGKWAWLLLFIASCNVYAFQRLWSDVEVASEGESNSIGSYANGCLAGGQKLPLVGEGYQVIRSQRHRYYGHRDMIAYLTQLARSVDKLGIGYLLVADISMPRGGRFTSGHASHQTGLDADIWLRLPNAPLNVEQAADPKPYPVVDIENYRFKKDKWTTNHELLLQVAAVDERVARLFVHPLIKKQLCDADWKDRGWLRKVRPWWGHYYHFHVRLHCPKGEPKCIAQSPPPQGEGCGKDLASWQPDSRALNKPADKATQKAPLRKRIAKPKFQECIALLAESQGGGY